MRAARDAEGAVCRAELQCRNVGTWLYKASWAMVDVVWAVSTQDADMQSGSNWAGLMTRDQPYENVGWWKFGSQPAQR